MKGQVFIVATPLGNLEDISHRALRILKEVDEIAAEDTRHSQRLLQHYGISTPLFSLHDHNETAKVALVLGKLQQGKRIALISDAGTPLISDPGYRLVHEALKAGIQVTPIPGPCAAIAALSVSGLPSDAFYFAGFLPAKTKARVEKLEALQFIPATLIFYESPYRILDLLQDLAAVLPERRVVILREMTKTFESFYEGSATDLYRQLSDLPAEVRGEFVVLVHGATTEPTADLAAALEIYHKLAGELPKKQALEVAAILSGLPKKRLYEEVFVK